MDIFYTPKQVNTNSNMGMSLSKSPLKPKLVVAKLLSGNHSKNILVHDFAGLTQADFEIAHEKSYVAEFLTLQITKTPLSSVQLADFITLNPQTVGGSARSADKS